MLLVYALVAGISLFVTAGILGYKGVKSTASLVLAILLGPVGIVWALLQPRSDEAWPRCPHCAERIRAEARVCRYCGRDVV
jgi:hypothetical protein